MLALQLFELKSEHRRRASLAALRFYLNNQRIGACRLNKTKRRLSHDAVLVYTLKPFSEKVRLVSLRTAFLPCSRFACATCPLRSLSRCALCKRCPLCVHAVFTQCVDGFPRPSRSAPGLTRARRAPRVLRVLERPERGEADQDGGRGVLRHPSPRLRLGVGKVPVWSVGSVRGGRADGLAPC
jgi:hypothetical protein